MFKNMLLMLKCNDPKTAAALSHLRTTENSPQVNPTLNAVRTKDLKTNHHLRPVIPKQPQDLKKKGLAIVSRCSIVCSTVMEEKNPRHIKRDQCTLLHRTFWATVG